MPPSPSLLLHHGAALLGVALSFLLPTSNSVVTTRAANNNPLLQVGVIQRFGEPDRPNKLEVSAPRGSMLTLEFTGSDGKLQTQQMPEVTITIANDALTSPELVQRLVLSSHLSFESAEASAATWQAKGIQTEIAQPDEWQVWAKRSAYEPLQLQQLLAQHQRVPGVRMFQEQRTSQRLLSWEHGNYRYNRTQLRIRSEAGQFGLNDRTYAGTLTLQPNAYGSYTAVNTVPIETYLRGVVPHEIGPNAPPAAIAAQAILARTYALKNLHRFRIDNYQLCANTHCQVYRGLTGTVAAADAAIQQTAGQVLTYDGQLVDAVYSSTSGGITAAFEDAWHGDPRPYLRSILDSTERAGASFDLSQPASFRQFLAKNSGFNEVGISRLFRWQIRQTLDELKEEFRKNQQYLGIALPQWREIGGLRVLTRSASGRVQAMQVDLRTDDGIHSIILDKDKIRLGFSNLYSTMFDLDPIQENGVLRGYTFVGAGFGHGVGMSQYGSYGLARRGFTSTQILKFYFPGTALKTIDSISLAATTPGG